MIGDVSPNSAAHADAREAPYHFSSSQPRAGGCGRYASSGEAFMRCTIVGAILICFTLNASAADDSVFGTHWVKFQPIQVAGDIQGCQLTFLTVTADRVYLEGHQVAVNGSIVLRATDRALGLMLKVGLKDLTSPSSTFERPAFAYLQTASGSTAKSRQQSNDGEPGYKLLSITPPKAIR